MTLGEYLKFNRKRLKYTQEYVTKQLNVTPQAVSKWELNIDTPSIELLMPISKFFKITTDELLCNEIIRNKKQ